MFVTFFSELKAAGVPVTLREYLTLMQAMDASERGTADVMRLEGTKKWLPGSADGFKDLVEALQGN